MFNELDLNFYIFFFLLSFFIVFFLVRFSNKLFFGLLIDKDYYKPQAFHKKAIARLGGFLIFSLLVVFIYFYSFTFKIILLDYLFIGFAFFLLGFLDDLKIKLNPYLRLFLMIIIIIFLTNFFSIKINQSGLAFLNYWLENNLFQVFFITLCFLFIINGSNFIDGFNGLLGIHFLIISFVYLLINIQGQNLSFSAILIGQMIIVSSFLFFNLPKAKIFLGDGGSYLLGSLIVLNTIKSHELNMSVSPFFFACVVFYVFFEVFFSFFRKSIGKKSPLQPDSKHLHMILYKFLKKYSHFKNHNFITSIIINLTYFFLIFPLLFFKKNALFCRYYFFILICIYIIFYFKLKKKLD